MSSSTLNFSRLAGLCIAMMALSAHAETVHTSRQSVCPSLLTEQECHDYQAAQRLTRSAEEKLLFENEHAALLKERARLCPAPIGLDAVGGVKASFDRKQPRPFAGRKISM